jgi:hypothetical protein
MAKADPVLSLRGFMQATGALRPHPGQRWRARDGGLLRHLPARNPACAVPDLQRGVTGDEGTTPPFMRAIPGWDFHANHG